MSYIENMPTPSDPIPVSSTEPADPPLLWDDLVEYVAGLMVDGDVDTDWVWDTAAVNGLMMNRDDMKAIALDSVPAELMLLLADAEAQVGL